MGKKIKSNNKIFLTNCVLGRTHKIVYVPGMGYRCKHCTKPKSQCTGAME
jgi:hypothetical protein